MLTEKNVLSAITILEDGQLQVRRSRQIWDDGSMIAEQYHRHVLEPGQDPSQEDVRVRQVCSAIWTPQVIADFAAEKMRRRSIS